MTLAPKARKLLLAIHLTAAGGWIGAVVAYLAIAVTAARSDDPQTIRSAWIAMEVCGWYAIVPLAVASLLTGIAIALATRWGLFRHHWVIFSLVLSTFATVILVLHMPTVSSTADHARRADTDTLLMLGSDIAHPAIGLLVLLTVQVLNVYKPRGLTRYGQRKVRVQAAVSPSAAAT